MHSDLYCCSLNLCRFAQFFLCPLFDESCKDREVNAVDSEHEKNLMNDAWRLFQLEKATGNPNHPFSKFGTGRKSPEMPLMLLFILTFCLHLSLLVWKITEHHWNNKHNNPLDIQTEDPCIRETI